MDEEDEINFGRRDFAAAQALLAATTSTRLPGFVDVGWYGSAVHPESGSFALVGVGQGLEELLGDVVKVTAPNGVAVFAYVVSVRDIATPLALSRRAFLGMDLLARSPASCIVEVV
jgi:hypothetical protein